MYINAECGNLQVASHVKCAHGGVIGVLKVAHHFGRAVGGQLYAPLRSRRKEPPSHFRVFPLASKASGSILNIALVVFRPQFSVPTGSCAPWAF